MNATTDAPARHLLVVDDDDRIRELLKEFLARAGFRVTVAPDAASARRMMTTLDFDLVVLDVMMPGEDGFSLTKSLRARGGAAGATPVLLLTARGEARDRIEGLSLGADDYLAKPFEPQELLLRIEAILRRAATRPSRREPVRLGGFTFDIERSELFQGEALIKLTEAEAQLLQRLAQNANAPIERMELASQASDAAGRAVDVQVTRLRRKIEADPKNPRYLLTARGVGYMLAPD